MNHRREEVQMITVKTYRGHIRNWKELCAELEIDPALPREEKEQEILVKDALKVLNKEPDLQPVTETEILKVIYRLVMQDSIVVEENSIRKKKTLLL